MIRDESGGPVKIKTRLDEIEDMLSSEKQEIPVVKRFRWVSTIIFSAKANSLIDTLFANSSTH